MSNSRQIEIVEGIYAGIMDNVNLNNMSLMEILKAMGVASSWVILAGDKKNQVNKYNTLILEALDNMLHYLDELHKTKEYPVAIDMLIASNLLANLAHRLENRETEGQILEN